MEQITIALSKGRLADYAVEILEKTGLDLANLKKDTRKLILEDGSGKFRFLFVKPTDVPIYVESGVADLGFVGKDTLLEKEKDLFELLDLNFGKCYLAIAGDERLDYGKLPFVKVATKYEQIAKKFFLSRGQEAEIIKLNGSIELAPIVGLSHVILDIVESGKTLSANNLKVLEKIVDISARLVSNKASLKTKKDILPLVEKIKEVLQ